MPFAELLDIYDTSKAPSSMLTSPDAADTGLLGDDVQLSPLEKGPLGEGGLGGISPSSAGLPGIAAGSTGLGAAPPTVGAGAPPGLGAGTPGLGQPGLFEKKRRRIRIGMG